MIAFVRTHKRGCGRTHIYFFFIFFIYVITTKVARNARHTHCIRIDDVQLSTELCKMYKTDK